MCAQIKEKLYGAVSSEEGGNALHMDFFSHQSRGACDFSRLRAESLRSDCCRLKMLAGLLEGMVCCYLINAWMLTGMLSSTGAGFCTYQ